MLRAILFLILIGSLGLSAWNAVQLAQNPAIKALTNRSGQELTARLNKELTKAATPANITNRLETLLSEEPTPWIAIRAVQDVAELRAIPLPEPLTAQIDAEYENDHGLLQTSGKCLSCGWDAANCELSAILLCRAPVDLTPVGDVAGVIRESSNYALGQEVDRLDLTLSAVGLGATVIAPATGGSSLAIKLGASTIKTTRKIGNLSPGLTRLLTKTADEAVDWKKLAKTRPSDFPDGIKAAINTDALRPVTQTLAAASDMRAHLGVLDTLHLMKFVESAEDATKTARISSAIGPRTVSAFEVVGKSRLLRATVRYTDEAIGAMIATIAAFISALGLVLSSIVTKAARTGLRRAK